MRRISLALALVGAVAVTGCGGSKSSTSSQKGVNDGTFNINIYQPPVGGSISTADGKIKCGASDLGTPTLNAAGDLVTTPTYLTGFATCPKQTAYPTGTATVPAPVVITAKAATGFVFVSWAGDCSGSAATCSVSGPGDKAPIAIFSKAGAAGHGNFLSATTHGNAFGAFMRGDAGSINCTSCHGMTLAGQGIAPACAPCHQAANVATAGKEACSKCHATSGSYHQAIFNTLTDPPTLTATIDSVTSTLNTDGVTYTSVVKFTLKKSGAAYGDATLSGLGQKRYTATRFDPVAKKFDTATAFGFSGLAQVSGVPGQYTVKATAAKFAPELTDSFVYFYFAEAPPIIAPIKHYYLSPNVASVAVGYGALANGLGYDSTANVSGCEKCHFKPYSKHGYRQATVAGIADMVACKSCHTDQRVGVDYNFQMVYDDPATFVTLPLAANGDPIYTAALQTKYAYTANVMNDTHMAHAMEIPYPQAMSNCSTCHAGKLDRILTDANFVGATCKSCHPISALNGNDPKRAPKLAPAYHNIDWVKGVLLETVAGVVTEMQCNECHNPTWRAPWPPFGPAPQFSDIHNGYDKAIYANATGTKYADTVKTQIDSATFDPLTNKITVNFSVTGLAAGGIVKPTVVASLYGYDTKDFLISGHSSQFTDKTPNLEWSEGAVIRGTILPANTNRLTVTPATAAAGTTAWVAVIDLTSWAANLADGSVKKAEIGILPSLGIVQTVAPQCDSTKAAYNQCVAMAGVTKTFDLVAQALVTDDSLVYGKAIVDTAKCNKCHDALGTTFHSPSYGSAGVVACRLCHFVGTGGSHLEMQSRSIDSYIHAIHSFQKMDIGSVNFADPTGVAQLEYTDHIEATYPMFTTLACESCHNAGTYDVPDQKKSMPGILSASSSLTGKTRAINGVPSVVTGPASRACGSCHRAEMIKEDAASALNLFDDHTGPSFGYRQVSDPAPATIAGKWLAKVKSLFP